VSFGQTKINTDFGKEWDISVRVDASETAQAGTYEIPITVSTTGGREATVAISATVMSYIDIVFDDLTFSPETPEDGQAITFEATISNDGDRPSGPLTIVLYDEVTNKRLGAQCAELDANETTTVQIETTASGTMGNVKAFVSSPSHERNIDNNYAYTCVNVCPPESPPRSAQDLYEEALNLYEDELWDAAAAGFSNAAGAFEQEGDQEMMEQSLVYMERAQMYSLAQQLYDEAKESEAQGNLALAEEKYKAAEELYTELEDRPKINACFSKILGLGAPNDDGGSDYPWYVFIIPIAALIVALGVVARGQVEARAVRSAEWDMLYRDLRDKYESGDISEDTYKELLERWNSRRVTREE
jgi:tetratricopeptide (TPR) repeat protein